MTDIVTSPVDATEEHQRGTGDVPVGQLYLDAKHAKDHTMNTREQLAAKFVSAGLTAAALGIEGRTKVIKVEMNKNIKKLKRKVNKATARKIGATVVIPE